MWTRNALVEERLKANKAENRNGSGGSDYDGKRATMFKRSSQVVMEEMVKAHRISVNKDLADMLYLLEKHKNGQMSQGTVYFITNTFYRIKTAHYSRTYYYFNTVKIRYLS